jgi:hypothetical protein
MELLYKLHQIRDVLERSKIAGFNRKLQVGPPPHHFYLTVCAVSPCMTPMRATIAYSARPDASCLCALCVSVEAP